MALILPLLTVSCVFAFEPMTIDNFKARPIPAFAQQLTGQDLVDYINIVQPFFEADLNEMSEEEQKARLMSKRFIYAPEERAEEVVLAEDEKIPESFDARTKWPECKSIKMVRDQSNCGSCWAVSGASAMSDRLCVQSNGTKQTILSDTDILSCCGKSCGYGCDGGFPIKAWRYIVKKGVCSGGPYGEKDVCKAYAFHPCGRHKGQKYYGECPDEYPTPKCRKTCTKGYKTKYAKDKIFGKNAYAVKNSVEAIQKEIMKNGPVQGAITTYEDFSHYKKGIYVHTAGKETGGHAIKIIGWGVEKKVPYWIVANSWNYDWGEDGHFRILRGKNECGIEEEVVAGMLKL
ncbi:hypothetical protein Aduo_003636 [Ancylostoma duodenale]